MRMAPVPQQSSELARKKYVVIALSMVLMTAWEPVTFAHVCQFGALFWPYLAHNKYSQQP